MLSSTYFSLSATDLIPSEVVSPSGSWLSSFASAASGYGALLETLKEKNAECTSCTTLQARVRLGSKLPESEQQFVRCRAKTVKAAVENLLGESIKSRAVPTIALCFSGGGFRAMIETLGSLQGADEIGLLDATMYTAGLSGSTWALAPWVASGLFIDEYYEQLKPKINHSNMYYVSDLAYNHRTDLLAMMYRKYSDNQCINMVDVYGGLLANILLDGLVDHKQMYTFADVQSNLETGNYPLPICTAVAGGVDNHHLWFEFTPYEIGNVDIGFVPTWAFGREFSDGESVLLPNGSFARPQTLGYLMGLWGSAFAVDGERLNFELGGYMESGLFASLEPMYVKSIAVLGLLAGYAAYEKGYISPDYVIALKNYFDECKKSNLGAATVPNFSYGMKHKRWFGWLEGDDVEFGANTHLSLVDGGFDLVDDCCLNIGIIPLLRQERHADIIIICDSSGKLNQAPALRAAENRARLLGLPFPEIDYKDIHTKVISVFQDPEDTSVPTIIYMPGIQNPSYGSFDPKEAHYAATVNFSYTPEQADELSGLTRHTMVECKDVIADAIRSVVEKKQSGWFRCF